MAQYQKPDAVFDSSRPHPKRIFLFDVDGTLTVPRKHITPEMHAYFTELRKKVRPHPSTLGPALRPRQCQQLRDAMSLAHSRESNVLCCLPVCSIAWA